MLVWSLPLEAFRRPLDKPVPPANPRAPSQLRMGVAQQHPVIAMAADQSHLWQGQAPLEGLMAQAVEMQVLDTNPPP